MDFDLNQVIEEQCHATVAKAIMEKLNSTDVACDVIISMAGMLPKQDMKWLINTLTSIDSQRKE